MLRSTRGRMQTYTGRFFTQFILIIIITILLILVGFGANILIEAQTAQTATAVIAIKDNMKLSILLLIL